MSAEIVKLLPDSVGEDFRFDADEVLEGAKGRDFAEMVIIGHLKDGEMFIAGNTGAGQTMILMEMAKRFIVFGERT